ncbi:MAG: ABC transporter permease subunit [Clostridiales Family XIII bacterium]|jgi:putative spermidine/putrescine transport system permease protein|nr:ABC transporter permease subunit [Clostridiales Family XIII bacterium]
MGRLGLKGLYYALGVHRFVEYLFFMVFLLFFYGPLMNLAMLAFTESYEYPAFFPNVISLKWWRFVLAQDNLVASMVTSLAVAILTTAISLCICLPAAYALARFDFPGKRFFQFAYLLSNAFPKIGLYIAIGVIFYRTDLMGTLTGVVLIHIVNTLMFMTWLPANAFENVPRSQEEAARDVGATPLQTFIAVTLPTAAPGILVASIFTFLGSMEEAQGSLLIGFPEIKTIPVVMYSVIFDYPISAGAVFSIILVIPTVVLVLLAGKAFGIRSLSDGFKLR